MKHTALALIGCGVFSGCTTVYENGRPVFTTSSNVTGLRFQSPSGSILEATAVNNSIVHQAIGNQLSKSILSAGTAVATGGTIFLKP